MCGQYEKLSRFESRFLSRFQSRLFKIGLTTGFRAGYLKQVWQHVPEQVISNRFDNRFQSRLFRTGLTTGFKTVSSTKFFLFSSSDDERLSNWRKRWPDQRFLCHGRHQLDRQFIGLPGRVKKKGHADPHELSADEPGHCWHDSRHLCVAPVHLQSRVCAPRGDRGKVAVQVYNRLELE